MSNKLDKVEKLRRQAQGNDNTERIAAQHARGKLTARERIDLLLDSGTFHEMGGFIVHRGTDFGLAEQKELGDAVVTGSGKIDGRQVFVFSQDFSFMGGSISEAVGLKVAQIMDMALERGIPVIGIYDSGGARIQEGVASLAGVGEMLVRNARCSGAIPQLAVVVGPSAGGAVYAPALCDFIFLVKNISQMYITGPDVVRAVTNEVVSHQELGGAEVHTQKSGVAHFSYDSEKECFQNVRRLFSFLPQNCNDKPLVLTTTDDPGRIDESLLNLAPEDPRQPYDMKKIISIIVDNTDFMEVQADYARNIICGLARLGGYSVGIVAQQPSYLAGTIDINAAVKAARFVRFCDAFNIPLVSLVDVPGFMPGTEQEHGGIIRHGAKLIYAYAEATVPKLTVITRKAYGGAYIVMSSRHLKGDINYAWPGAEIAVMGAEAAVNIIYRKQIAGAANPTEKRHELVAEYRTKFDNPLQAAGLGYIDDIIDPRRTRPILIHALEMLRNKSQKLPVKKHDNIPL
jgi:acetyl-CoA carboxylase carboxyltransferase component